VPLLLIGAWLAAPAVAMAAASSALSFGAAVLSQMENIGQAAQLGQSHLHQREQILWQRRSYKLDSQSVRLDALDHAKEEIKSHYDTYVGRIDTLLLVLALIFPFALNVIQFSDPFVPNTPEECPDCIETEYAWLVIVWSGLIGIVLVMPFWGILMLLRCKLQLDRWLEYSLAGLHQKRRDIVAASDPAHVSMRDGADASVRDQETEQIVFSLVSMVLRYQEFMAKAWNSELGRLVHASTVLLWLSASSALMLTSLSIWMYLVNKGGEHTTGGCWFAVIITIGYLGPVLYLSLQNLRLEVVRAGDLGPDFEEDVIREDTFPLARHASVSALRSSSKPMSPFRRATSPCRELFGRNDHPSSIGSSISNLFGTNGGGSGSPGGGPGWGMWCSRRRRVDRPVPEFLDGLEEASPSPSHAAALPRRPSSSSEEPLLPRSHN